MGAALVLVVRRWPAIVRLIWLLSALAALAFALPLWPAADLQLPWTPGTPDVALLVSLHVDALTFAFAGALTLIAVAVSLIDLGAAAPWRVVVGRQLAFALALLAVAAADLAVAASAVLLLPLAAGLSRRFDDERLATLGGLFAAGFALLAAAAFGASSGVGFLLLVGAALFLLFQAPFSSLAETALGGLVGAFAANLATIVLPGMAIVFRFGIDSPDPARLQLLAAFGATTMALAGLSAAQTSTLPALLGALTSLQAGAVLVALGQGIAPTQPAAILIGLSAVLALTALSLTTDRLAVGLGTSTLDGMVGGGRALPASALLAAVTALALSPLPLLGGAPIGGAVSLAGALSDGRLVIAGVVLIGLSGSAAGLSRLAICLFAPTPATPPLREHLLALVAAGLPLMAAIAAGALAFTAWDPAARAAIAAFGLRPRPTGGELFALPWWGALGAVGALLVATVVGVLAGARRHRPSRLASHQPRGERALAPLDGAAPDGGRPDNRTPWDTRPILGRVAAIGRFALWTFAEGLAVLEGRYFMATVLVLGLWALIMFLG